MKTIITPPDIFVSSGKSILLIEPTEAMSVWFNSLIDFIPDEIYTYIYPRFTTDIKWLLTTAKQASLVVIDPDELTQWLQPWSSFIISLPQTKYHSTNENWHLISNRQIKNYNSINLQDIL